MIYKFRESGIMEKEKCPCCSNHCEKDNLSCGRGRDYFSTSHTEEKSETIEEVVMDLRKCGHLLHHNRDLSTNGLFNNFSKDELEQLHILLVKVYNNVE